MGPWKAAAGAEESRAAPCLGGGAGGGGSGTLAACIPSVPQANPVPTPTPQTPGCPLGSDPRKGWRRNPNTPLGQPSRRHRESSSLPEGPGLPALSIVHPEGIPNLFLPYSDSSGRPDFKTPFTSPRALWGSKLGGVRPTESFMFALSSNEHEGTKVGSYTFWVACAVPGHCRCGL